MGTKLSISGRTSIYGLVGYPIKHSLSPAMHNAAFSYIGIDGVYLCFEVKESKDVKVVISGLKASGVMGLNITVPYKEVVMKFLDEVTVVAKRIGAVNTVFRRNNKFIGTNTDAEGFIRSLRDDCRFVPKGKGILIIGAGGAGKAVGFAVADALAKVVFIADRTYAKAKKVSQRIRSECKVSVFAVKMTELENIAKDVNLVVNATGVGRDEMDKPVVDLGIFSRETLVYDLIYNPKMPVLLREARKRKMPYSNGLGMLLWQGAVAFKHWTKADPPIEVMKRAIMRAIR